MNKNNKILGMGKKKMKDIYSTITKYSLVMVVGFVLLGLFGMVAALGFTVIAPLSMGVFGMASSGRPKWKNLGTGQKAGIGGFLVFLAPFMLAGILWLTLTSVSYWIDTLIIIMIVFLTLYFYYNSRYGTDIFHVSMLFMAFGGGSKKKAQLTGLGKIFGSKIILIVGIIIALVFLVSTTFHTIAIAGSTSNASGHNSTALMSSDAADPNDIVNSGNISVPIDEIPTEPNKWDIDINDLPIFTDLYLGVYDTMLVRDANGNIEYSAERVTQTISAGEVLVGDNPITTASYPIPLATVTIKADVVETKYVAENETTGEEQDVLIKPMADARFKTDVNGIAVIRGISYGYYDVVIEKAGYKTLNTEMFISEEDVKAGRERLKLTDVEIKTWLQGSEFVPDKLFVIKPVTYTVSLIYDCKIAETNLEYNYTSYQNVSIKVQKDASMVETYDLPEEWDFDALQTVLNNWQKSRWDYMKTVGYTVVGGEGLVNLPNIPIVGKPQNIPLVGGLVGSIEKTDKTCTLAGHKTLTETDVNDLVTYTKSRKDMVGTNLTSSWQIYEYEASYAQVGVTAVVSGGIDIGSLTITNRYDDWYRTTGLPVYQQNMLVLSNTMMNLQNSYWGGLQSVLPAMQSLWSGEGITLPDINIVERTLFTTYKQHTVEYIPTIQTSGGSAPNVYLLPSATTGNPDSNVSTTRTNWATSPLTTRVYNFMVSGNNADEDANIDLTFQFTTDIDITSVEPSISLGNHTQAGETVSTQIITLVTITLGDARAPITTNGYATQPTELNLGDD